MTAGQARRVRPIAGAVGICVALLAAACGGPDPEHQLSAHCGPVEFSSIPPDLDEFPPLDDDAQAAMDELMSGPTGIQAQGFDDRFEWSIATRSDDDLIVFGQAENTTGPLWAVVRFDQRDGGWNPVNWGTCHVEIDAPGLGTATVATDPDETLDPESTELQLQINERNCAGGQAPVDREVLVLITETDESVTIIVLVAPVEGGADCPGNPWHPITVTLDAPLGSRRLLDGHTYPQQPIVSADLAG